MDSYDAGRQGIGCCLKWDPEWGQWHRGQKINWVVKKMLPCLGTYTQRLLGITREVPRVPVHSFLFWYCNKEKRKEFKINWPMGTYFHQIYPSTHPLIHPFSSNFHQITYPSSQPYMKKPIPSNPSKRTAETYQKGLKMTSGKKVNWERESKISQI